MKEGKIKKKIIELYNFLYDKKLDIQLFFHWRKDLQRQKNMGLPSVMSIDETLDKIINEKCSICRYGDGEFKLMDGDRIFFQEDSEKLRERLLEVIDSKQDDILVCIPTFLDRRHKIFINRTVKNLTKEERKRRKNAIKYMDNILFERRIQWYSYFDMNRLYGNSLISRFYASVYDDEKSERWINKWKRIWENREILIIEGEKTRLGVGNDLFNNAKSIRRVLGPNVSAFLVYDQILNIVKTIYKADELVLIALGPTATVLSYDLAKEGIQALDIGHIDIEYEWFLRKDHSHQKIEGKFVSEAYGGDKVSNIKEQSYLEEIVYRVGGK